MVICTSLLGAHISAVLFALLLLVATLLMFLWSFADQDLFVEPQSASVVVFF
jgi:ABC-type transporter Mla subunit MlaD